MSFNPRTPEELAETWPPELDHVSASSLKQFARCPEQWRTVRLQGLRQRPAGAIIQGKADHAAIGEHFQIQIEDGVGLRLADVEDSFVSHFEREVNNEGLTEIDWGKTATATSARSAASKVKDAGVKLVGEYHSTVIPYFKAEHVETAFALQLPDLPIRIDGYIDVQGTYVSPFDGEPTSDLVIIERKTAARAGMNPETVMQGRIYQLAEALDVDVHVSVKRGFIEWGTPALRIAYSPELYTLTVQQVGQLLRTMAFYYTQYGPDHPWPGNITHPWACNYCGFRPNCHWWKY